MPQNTFEWKELPVKRIFSTAGTYEEGMEKLVFAEDTSNVDDMSSDTLREQKKQRRRLKAKRNMSSSSDEDVCLNVDEDNHVRQTPAKLLPTYPQIGDFVSCNKKLHIYKSIQDSPKNVLCERNTSYTMSGSDRTINTEVFTRKDLTEKPSGDSDTENSFTREYKKIVLGKLNKIIFKLNNIEKRMDILENKMQSTNYNDQEKVLILLPISTFNELTSFEEQLQEVKFKDEVINTFKLVGGNTAHIMIRSISKKVITDIFAQHFSWAGKKAKKSFQDLGLARIITHKFIFHIILSSTNIKIKYFSHNVRTTHKHVTDADVAETIAKWLAQATVRLERAKQDEINKKQTG